MRFLIGTWEAGTQAGSAKAASTGTYSFHLELKGHVLARRSSNANCKAPADFDCEHGDLLYIYRDASATPLKAIYFDNEGHTIHYEVSTTQPNTVVFVSNEKDPGPQYRLSYELKGARMSGKFEMKLPGQADFTSYLEWSGGKK